MIHLYAQNTPAAPTLGPLVRRFVQGSLWTPPGPTSRLIVLVVAGLVLLATLAALVQWDARRFLRGLVDIRAHLELISDGLDILRRNKRPVWVILSGAVLSWTVWSLHPAVWQDRAALAELEAMLAARENSAAAFAASHALATALVPWHALASLGDFLPLVIAAGLALFVRTTDVAQQLDKFLPPAEREAVKRRLGTVWIALVLWAGYRTVMFLYDPASAPLASCLYLDCVLSPLLALVADGFLLSWVVTEYGRGLRGHREWQQDDTLACARVLPLGIFCCLVTNPARYAVLSLAMIEQQFGASSWAASRWGPVFWAAAVVQALGLTWFALPGLLAARRGRTMRAVWSDYLALFRHAGGQVVGLTALAVVLTFLVAFVCYWVFGSMQPETWSLIAASSYGHYGTLLLALVLLAGLSELARRELGLSDDSATVPIVLEPTHASSDALSAPARE